MIDLRKNGPFGRNAMYYACLCGHVDAVHFIATHAYGGVKVHLLCPALKSTEKYQ